jgi:hypothetical protein
MQFARPPLYPSRDSFRQRLLNLDFDPLSAEGRRRAAEAAVDGSWKPGDIEKVK